MGQNEWSFKKFGECAELIKEVVNPKDCNSVPYIGLEHIREGSLNLIGIGNSNDVISNKFKFKEGDILFGKLRPYFRKIILAPFSGICSTDIWVIRAKKNIDQKFLFYLMASPRFIEAATRASEGTKMPRAKWEFLARLEYLLPNYIEQEKIGLTLNTLDKKIDINNNINYTLKRIVQTLFKSWFLDFEFSSKNNKSYKSGSGEMINSKIGKIPKDWKVVMLRDFIKLERGLSYKGSGLSQTGTPMINLGSISADNGLIYRGLKYYSGKYVNRNLVKAGDLVIANTDMTQNREVLGSVILVPFNLASDKILFTHHIYAVRNESLLSNNFIYCLLQSDRYRNRVAGFATGTTVLDLPQDAILDLEFAIPSSNQLLERFDALINKMLIKIENNVTENICIADIRDLLILELIFGKLKIPLKVSK